MTIEVRMSKKLAMSKDATLSKEMMKIVRMRLMGLRMRSPPKVEVKPKVLDLWRVPFCFPFFPTLVHFPLICGVNIPFGIDRPFC